jgi:hypothetical protein
MARQHYTERDIVDLHAGGCHVLELSPDDRLTDLARERAAALGVSVVLRASGYAPADLHARVRQAVVARLGDSVDLDLIDRIIVRVLAAMGKA